MAGEDRLKWLGLICMAASWGFFGTTQIPDPIFPGFEGWETRTPKAYIMYAVMWAIPALAVWWGAASLVTGKLLGEGKRNRWDPPSEAQ
jgi:hypothetical protein